jgi:predicted nucleic acid-binding Zn ribbon protein
MICLNCKKQIPDDSVKCPECGAEIFHREQVKKEISLRRYQRWFFYSVLIIVFCSMAAWIVKTYLDKADLLLEMSVAQKTLEGKSVEVDLLKSDLEQKQADLQKIQDSLGQEKDKLSGELTLAEAELSKKIEELSSAVEEKLSAIVEYEKINSAFLNISEVAAGISNDDLNKIPIADVWPIGPDVDGDGLPEDVEKSLGTDPSKADSDNDGYSDRAEISGGFNPLGDGNLPYDQAFADKQKGRIFKQIWGGGYVWYVSQAGKRYFLSPIKEKKPEPVSLDESPVLSQEASSETAVTSNSEASNSSYNPMEMGVSPSSGSADNQ